MFDYLKSSRPEVFYKKGVLKNFWGIFKNTFFYRTPLPFFNIVHERVNSRSNYAPAYNYQKHYFKYSLLTFTLEVQFNSDPSIKNSLSIFRL